MATTIDFSTLPTNPAECTDEQLQELMAMAERQRKQQERERNYRNTPAAKDAAERARKNRAAQDQVNRARLAYIEAEFPDTFEAARSVHPDPVKLTATS